LPNVFSCTLIQLCSSTAMANTHARWAVSVSGSGWEGGVVPFALLELCYKSNKVWILRRPRQSMFNQSVSNMTAKAIMTSSGKGQRGCMYRGPLILSTRSGI
jgi:hypothetical protein